METPVPQNARSIARNIAYGGMTWILPVALSLIATPVIVGSLGVEVYGIYALVLGMIGYSFSFGVGRAVTKYIAEYRITGQSEKIREVLSVTLLLGLGIGLFGAIVTILSARFLVSDILLIPDVARDSTILAVYVAAVVILVSIFNQIFGAILQGVHRFDLYSKLYNLGSIALMSGNLVLAWWGFGVTALLLWNLITVTISTIVIAIYSRKFLPEIVAGPRFSKASVKLFGGYSASIIGYQLVTNVMLLFERAWVTRTLGSESLGYYVVAATPGLFMQAFVGSLVLMMMPLVSEKTARADEMLPFYTKATRLVFVITTFFVMILVVGSDSFLTLWMGAEFASRSDSLLAIHAVSFGIPAILSVTWQMKEGMGVPRYNFFAGAVSTLVGIPLMIWFSRLFGAEGVAVARLLAFIVMSLSLIHFELWAFKRLQLKFWFQLIVTLAVCTALASLVQWLILSSFGVNWVVFVLAAIAAGSVFFVAAWALRLISDEEQGQLLRFLRLA